MANGSDEYEHRSCLKKPHNHLELKSEQEASKTLFQAEMTSKDGNGSPPKKIRISLPDEEERQDLYLSDFAFMKEYKRNLRREKRLAAAQISPPEIASYNAINLRRTVIATRTKASWDRLKTIDWVFTKINSDPGDEERFDYGVLNGMVGELQPEPVDNEVLEIYKQAYNGMVRVTDNPPRDKLDVKVIVDKDGHFSFNMFSEKWRKLMFEAPRKTP